MNITAYIISILAFIFSISSSFIKGHTKIQMGVILTFTFLSNFFAGLGYIVNETGINGTVSCMLGAIISIINFFYRMKIVFILWNENSLSLTGMLKDFEISEIN